MPIQLLNRNNTGTFTLVNKSNSGAFSMSTADQQPSPTPSVSITPSITVSSTPSVSVTPSITVSSTPSVSVTPSISASVTPSVSVSITPSISVTPSITPTITPSISPTPSVSPGSSIVSSGLVLNLDASNASSYPGSGTTWTDLSGNNNTGELVNGPTYSSNNGGYIILDGNNDYINVPNNSTLNSNVTTVSVWFRYSTVNNYYGALISKADPAGTFNGWNIYIFNNVINAQIKANPSTTDIPGTTISTNTWYNVTLVSVSGGTSSLYLNNSLLNSRSTVSYTVTASQPLRFARAVDTFWSYFGGNVGQIIQYNRALNSTELTQNFNATKTRFGL
jgi:hypothetical protein